MKKRIQRLITILLCLTMLTQITSILPKTNHILTQTTAQAATSYVNIANGTYTITTKVKNQMMLDVTSGYSANGTNIQIYQNNESSAQEFVITHIRSGWYKICNKASGKALDVKDASKKSGTNVQLYQYNGSDAQLWRFYSANNGYYYIQNKLGYYLDVAGGNSSNNTNVQVYTKNSTNSQKWKPIKVIYPTNIKLNTTSVTLKSIGATQKLNATIYPSNATQKKITWISSNNKIATVSNGTVKAVGNGNTTITAKMTNGKKATAKVTIKDNCASITEGLYTINTKLSKTMMLDVTGNQTTDGTNIEIYQNNEGVSQKFRIESCGNGWYIITNNTYPSKKCIEAKKGSNQNKMNVQLREYDGSTAQQWRFFSVGNGYYTIMNKLGLYLNVDNITAKNGVNVSAYTKKESNAQKWKLTKTSSDYLNIVNSLYSIYTKTGNNMVIDAAGNGIANGTNIQIYQGNDSLAQKFYIQNTGDGWYKITNLLSGKCLDVQGAINKNGTNVQLYTYNGTDAQKWRFYQSGNTVLIKNKLGRYLDVQGAGNKNGTNVQIYQKNNSNAQKWNISKTSAILLNSTSFTLDGIGKTKTLSVRFDPSDVYASNKSITWSSSNTKIATVSNGIVKAVGAGSATITAKAYNGKTATAVVTVNTNTYTTKTICITSNGQTVDTFNGVPAKYITGTGNSNTGSYCCAEYVTNYYRKVYGITVANMFTGRTPSASSGYFYLSSSPKSGDIGYQLNSNNSGHWFIIKSVNSDGTYTIIEQNWKWKNGNATYCYQNRKVSYATTKGFKVFRWSNRVN